MLQRLTTLITLSILVASCATQDHAVSAIWHNPAANHGRIFDVVGHPYDLLSDPGRYVLCFDPCSEAQAAGQQAVLLPLEDGRFDGFKGDRAVQLRLRFDGGCFADGALCLLDHRPFVFVEETWGP